jgi:glutamyl-tRNA(Gln) amidotransferase subunit E
MFAKTESKILLNALKSGGKVYAVKLKGFNGLTGKELCQNRRLGTEMSDHAKFKGGVRGIFHTDELPGYKITQPEVDKLRKTMGAEAGDAVVIVADDESKCKSALIAVVDRAVQALSGVPAETRSANQDGTTRFTRPRPGAARMYPETDVRPIQISADAIAMTLKDLPDMPEVKLEKTQKKFNLNSKLATQILDSDHYDLFEELVVEEFSPTLIAVTLTEDLTSMRRDGVPVENLNAESIRGTFSLVKLGTTVKETIPDILTYLAKNPSRNPTMAIRDLGLEMMSDEDVKQLVESVVKERESLVKERGMKAMGPLMGVIMGKARGRASPQKVNKLLNASIRAIIE